MLAALEAALSAQKEFRRQLRQGDCARGSRTRPQGVRKIVIIGRPYNTCDRGLNLDLPKKLLDLGVLPVPMEAVLTDGATLSEDWDNMYWKYGQRILAAAEKIAGDTDI